MDKFDKMCNKIFETKSAMYKRIKTECEKYGIKLPFNCRTMTTEQGKEYSNKLKIISKLVNLKLACKRDLNRGNLKRTIFAANRDKIEFDSLEKNADGLKQVRHMFD